MLTLLSTIRRWPCFGDEQLSLRLGRRASVSIYNFVQKGTQLRVLCGACRAFHRSVMLPPKQPATSTSVHFLKSSCRFSGGVIRLQWEGLLNSVSWNIKPFSLCFLRPLACFDSQFQHLFLSLPRKAKHDPRGPSLYRNARYAYRIPECERPTPIETFLLCIALLTRLLPALTRHRPLCTL